MPVSGACIHVNVSVYVHETDLCSYPSEHILYYLRSESLKYKLSVQEITDSQSVLDDVSYTCGTTF